MFSLVKGRIEEGFKTREGLEGMENGESSNSDNNYGGNAAVYASNLKNSVSKYHDKVE